MTTRTSGHIELARFCRQWVRLKGAGQAEVRSTARPAVLDASGIATPSAGGMHPGVECAREVFAGARLETVRSDGGPPAQVVFFEPTSPGCRSLARQASRELGRSVAVLGEAPRRGSVDWAPALIIRSSLSSSLPQAWAALDLGAPVLVTAFPPGGSGLPLGVLSCLASRPNTDVLVSFPTSRVVATSESAPLSGSPAGAWLDRLLGDPVAWRRIVRSGYDRSERAARLLRLFLDNLKERASLPTIPVAFTPRLDLLEEPGDALVVVSADPDVALEFRGVTSPSTPPALAQSRIIAAFAEGPTLTTAELKSRMVTSGVSRLELLRGLASLRDMSMVSWEGDLRAMTRIYCWRAGA